MFLFHNTPLKTTAKYKKKDFLKKIKMKNSKRKKKNILSPFSLAPFHRRRHFCHRHHLLGGCPKRVGLRARLSQSLDEG